MSFRLPSTQVESVAIIGGGASGSIALDSLVQEDHVKSITLFERRLNFGGIWNFDEERQKTPSNIKPGHTGKKTDPQLENPFNLQSQKGRFVLLPKNTQERYVTTPSYKGLTTNIIEEIMTFSDNKRWDIPGESDPDKTRYADGLLVRNYIDAYIKRHIDNEKVSIINNTSVEDVEVLERNTTSEDEIPYRYKLTLRQSVSPEYDVWWQENYDAVVVATGHYFVPFIPQVKGLAELQELVPEKVEHAKYYRSPKDYKDATVVVVGSRALGADLAKYIADEAKEVYQSIRNLDATKVVTKKTNVYGKGIISEFRIINEAEKTFKVIFEDGSEVSNPDHVIYATGYQFSFPFLDRLVKQKSGDDVTKDGSVIQHSYQHTFLIDHPLLTIIGMPIDGMSFRVFEFQAVLVSRYLAGKVVLPPREEQIKWYEDRLSVKGTSRSFHTIGFEDALEYHQALTKLGEENVGDKKVGRPFPVLTKADYDEYIFRALRLREIWDSR